ncbi:MAG TPA: helix-turn-helix transcriptional regulator [Solirubrobacterales bacterium]|nr:helix-turn-helix transcriptional regulator [Solirubrobacterales bacterium]
MRGSARAATAGPDELVDDAELRARRPHQLRRAAGLSRNELAKQSGLSNRLLEEIEKGRRPNTSISNLIKLARALRVSLDFFATGDGQAGLPILHQSGHRERLKGHQQEKGSN